MYRWFFRSDILKFFPRLFTDLPFFFTGGAKDGAIGPDKTSLEKEIVMVAFYLGVVLGALGGFMFLGLLSIVVGKDRGMDLADLRSAVRPDEVSRASYPIVPDSYLISQPK